MRAGVRAAFYQNRQHMSTRRSASKTMATRGARIGEHGRRATKSLRKKRDTARAQTAVTRGSEQTS